MSQQQKTADDIAYRHILTLAEAVEWWAKEIAEAKVEWIDVPDAEPVPICGLVHSLDQSVGFSQIGTNTWTDSPLDHAIWWLEWHKSPEYARLFRERFEMLRRETGSFLRELIGCESEDDPDEGGDGLDYDRHALYANALRFSGFVRSVVAFAGGPVTFPANVIDVDADIEAGGDIQHAKGTRGVTAAEANVKAREAISRLWKKHGRRPTAKELSEDIGCSQGLVSGLPAWQAVLERERKQRSAKTVRFTEQLEQCIGRDDEELNRLVEDQAEDDRNGYKVRAGRGVKKG